MKQFVEKWELKLLAVCLLLLVLFLLVKAGLDGEAVWGDDLLPRVLQENEAVRTQGTAAQHAKGQQGTAAQHAKEQPEAGVVGEKSRQEDSGDDGQAKSGDANGSEAGGQGQEAAPAADPAGASGSPVIRVLIRTDNFSGCYHGEIRLRSEGPLAVNDGAAAVGAGEELCIRPDSEWFRDGHLRVTPGDPSSGIDVLSITRAQGTPSYEGCFDVYQREEGLVLVNEVDLEAYLRLVVPSEMPSSYAPEALKAQAVCARTYAWSRILDNDLADFHADVDDSVSCQVYNNIAAQPSTDQAVAETAGEIMTWEGRPITAYFFSTSCGFTSTDEVWNPEVSSGYLKSVWLGEEAGTEPETEEAFAAFITSGDESNYEAGDGWYRWRVTLPVSYLNERIADLGVGTLVRLAVTKRSGGGAAERLTVTGTGGEAVLENEYQIRSRFSTAGFSIEKNDGTTSDQMQLMPSAYFILQEERSDGELAGYTFVGGGYGHGVGMSQNAAAHMAEEGMDYREILSFFYNQIQLETIAS